MIEVQTAPFINVGEEFMVRDRNDEHRDPLREDVATHLGAQGSVRYWDHQAQTDVVLAHSVRDFIAKLSGGDTQT